MMILPTCSFRMDVPSLFHSFSVPWHNVRTDFTGFRPNRTRQLAFDPMVLSISMGFDLPSIDIDSPVHNFLVSPRKKTAGRLSFGDVTISSADTENKNSLWL